jgi:hypothetical protein
MAYIGETVRDVPDKVIEGGLGIITLPNTQNNTLMFNTAYKDTIFKFVNINTTLTMTSTNNYYCNGEIEVLGNAVFDVAGSGNLRIVG